MDYETIALFYLMGNWNDDTVRLAALIKWITKEECKTITGKEWELPSMAELKKYHMEYILKDPKYMGDDVQS